MSAPASTVAPLPIALRGPRPPVLMVPTLEHGPLRQVPTHRGIEPLQSLTGGCCNTRCAPRGLEPRPRYPGSSSELGATPCQGCRPIDHPCARHHSWQSGSVVRRRGYEPRPSHIRSGTRSRCRETPCPHAARDSNAELPAKGDHPIDLAACPACAGVMPRRYALRPEGLRWSCLQCCPRASPGLTPYGVRRSLHR